VTEPKRSKKPKRPLSIKLTAHRYNIYGNAPVQRPETLRLERRGWGWITIRDSEHLIQGFHLVAGLGSQIPHAAPIYPA
jgi:hypothetical protein